MDGQTDSRLDQIARLLVRDHGNWAPHITLALGVADGLIEKAIEIAGKKIPISLAADRLAIK